MSETIGTRIFEVAIRAIAILLAWAALLPAIVGMLLLGIALAVHAASDELTAWARSL